MPGTTLKDEISVLEELKGLSDDNYKAFNKEIIPHRPGNPGGQVPGFKENSRENSQKLSG